MREINPPTRRISKKLSSREARRSRFDAESELFTIDNTEDIYGTKLLPNQRCYVDPWDLENYDYVRSKIDHSSSPSSYYSMSNGPINNELSAENYSHISPPYGYFSHYDLDCYDGPYNDDIYDSDNGKLNLLNYSKDDENELGICSEEFSSSSSCNEPMTLQTSYLPPYEYCNPYSTLRPPYVSDCYECSFNVVPRCSSLIYDKCMPGGMSSLYGSTGNYSLKRPSSSSLYDGIYSHKFGLSKKGLLQIDYSCSWNELDRVIGRTADYYVTKLN